MLNVRRKSLPDLKGKSPDNVCLETNQRFGIQKKLDSLIAKDKEILQNLSFSGTFYSNAYKKLDEICSMANRNKTCYASPDIALLELNSFITILPRELKEKAKPLQNQAIDSVTKRGRIPLQPKYYGGFVEMVKEAERIPDKDFLNDCYNWVLKLANKVSSLMHESKKDNLTLFSLNQADKNQKKTPNPILIDTSFSANWSTHHFRPAHALKTIKIILLIYQCKTWRKCRSWYL
jgi:hypothetical protein